MKILVYIIISLFLLGCSEKSNESDLKELNEHKLLGSTIGTNAEWSIDSKISDFKPTTDKIYDIGEQPNERQE